MHAIYVDPRAHPMPCTSCDVMRCHHDQVFSPGVDQATVYRRVARDVVVRGCPVLMLCCAVLGEWVGVLSWSCLRRVARDVVVRAMLWLGWAGLTMYILRKNT